MMKRLPQLVIITTDAHKTFIFAEAKTPDFPDHSFDRNFLELLAAANRGLFLSTPSLLSPNLYC